MRVWQRRAASAVLIVAFAAFAQTVGAQPAAPAPDPNPLNTGALTFTGGFDLPSVYVFRGLVQESAPTLTLQPYGTLGITLATTDDGARRIGVDVGVWNSLQTGSSGTSGPSRRLHYAENFFTTLSYGLGRSTTVSGTFTAYTSPNAMFDTIKEASLKVSRAGRLHPYGLIAFELSDTGQADLGAKKGTYGEFGARLSVLRRRMFTIDVPARVGLSVKNYYELAGTDHRFGFADIGGLVTMPLGALPSRYGRWNLHGGVDLLTLGDTTRATNAGKKTRVVGLIGVGLIY